MQSALTDHTGSRQSYGGESKEIKSPDMPVWRITLVGSLTSVSKLIDEEGLG